MKNLLLSALLKVILLNDEPISIGDEWIEIAPEQSFEAIMSGAEFWIKPLENNEQLSRYRECYNQPYENCFKLLRQLIPEGSIEAQLIWADGTIFHLTSIGFASSEDTKSNKPIFFITISNMGIPVKTKFSKLRIRSDIQIENTSVYWANGRWK